MRQMFGADGCQINEAGISSAGNPLSRAFDAVTNDPHHARQMRDGYLGGMRPPMGMGGMGGMMDPMMKHGDLESVWHDMGPQGMRPQMMNGPAMGAAMQDQFMRHMQANGRGSEMGPGFFEPGQMPMGPGGPDWAQEFAGPRGMPPQMMQMPGGGRPQGPEWAMEFGARGPQAGPPGSMEAAFRQAQGRQQQGGPMSMEASSSSSSMGPQMMNNNMSQMGMPMMGMGMGMPMMGGMMGRSQMHSQMPSATEQYMGQKSMNMAPAPINAAPAIAPQGAMDAAFRDAQMEEAFKEAQTLTQADLGQAAQMVEMLRNSGNPKFANSQFVNFIDKVSKGDLQFKENTVIDREGNQVAGAFGLPESPMLYTASHADIKQLAESLWQASRKPGESMQSKGLTDELYSNGVPLDEQAAFEFFKGVYEEVYKSGPLGAPPVFNEVPRESFTVATKYMPLLREGKCDYDSVKAALLSSLERLGLAHVDVVLSCEAGVEFARSAKQLMDEGLVRNIGLSEVSSAWLRDAHAAQEWSLLTRNIEESLVPTCRELGIGIVAYSPLARFARRMRGVQACRGSTRRQLSQLEALASKKGWHGSFRKLGTSRCLSCPFQDNIASVQISLAPDEMPRKLPELVRARRLAREAYMGVRVEGQELKQVMSSESPAEAAQAVSQAAVEGWRSWPQPFQDWLLGLLQKGPEGTLEVIGALVEHNAKSDGTDPSRIFPGATAEFRRQVGEALAASDFGERMRAISANTMNAIASEDFDQVWGQAGRSALEVGCPDLEINAPSGLPGREHIGWSLQRMLEPHEKKRSAKGVRVQRNPESSEGWLGQLYAEMDQDVQAIQCLQKGHEACSRKTTRSTRKDMVCTGELLASHKFPSNVIIASFDLEWKFLQVLSQYPSMIKPFSKFLVSHELTDSVAPEDWESVVEDMDPVDCLCRRLGLPRTCLLLRVLATDELIARPELAAQEDEAEAANALVTWTSPPSLCQTQSQTQRQRQCKSQRKTQRQRQTQSQTQRQRQSQRQRKSQRKTQGQRQRKTQRQTRFLTSDHCGGVEEGNGDDFASGGSGSGSGSGCPKRRRLDDTRVSAEVRHYWTMRAQEALADEDSRSSSQSSRPEPLRVDRSTWSQNRPDSLPTTETAPSASPTGNPPGAVDDFDHHSDEDYESSSFFGNASDSLGFAVWDDVPANPELAVSHAPGAVDDNSDVDYEASSFFGNTSDSLGFAVWDDVPANPELAVSQGVSEHRLREARLCSELDQANSIMEHAVSSAESANRSLVELRHQLVKVNSEKNWIGAMLQDAHNTMNVMELQTEELQAQLVGEKLCQDQERKPVSKPKRTADKSTGVVNLLEGTRWVDLYDPSQLPSNETSPAESEASELCE
ncbi:unnamed protein product [Polarella glacialis]|uniref:NADP-dependent oxidoreductase domain-containing protein n=1 Tax=Polarella glacialis TaxID=89957 RepID=A0A813HU35_POLGL|nr:unnamed protein product [Polarella glacialis]